MSEKEEYTKEQEYFNDWYSDNKYYLMSEFCSDNESYDVFVKEEFEIHKEEVRY